MKDDLDDATLFNLHWDNYVSKAFDQLKGICYGILADGVVNNSESNFFRQWVEANKEVETTWPFSDIAARVTQIFKDGIVTDDERAELRAIIEEITGGAYIIDAKSRLSTTLPLCHPQPSKIFFESNEFCVTGRFAFGTRAKVIDAICDRGGIFHPAPRRCTKYLVIGHFVTRDWKYTDYGTKIERAVELRSDASGIRILSEETWGKALVTA